MQEDKKKLNKPKVIILDVYETILDMSDFERKVNQLLDSSKGYMLWFETFMQYCFVDNCIVQFNDFTAIAKATMQMTGQRLGRSLEEADIGFVLELLKHLPVHDGVQEGLSSLNDQGFRIAALTNSSDRIVCDRMERTGLISYFEMVLSAEQVKKYKPALEVYQWAAKKLSVDPKDALLISAHGWDIAGAAGAGMQTAYIVNDREMLYPLAPEPDMFCKGIGDLANQLEATQQEG